VGERFFELGYKETALSSAASTGIYRVALEAAECDAEAWMSCKD
jgi:hypothetical protein